MREVRGKRGWSTKVNFEVMATRNRCMDLFGGIVKVNLEKWRTGHWLVGQNKENGNSRRPVTC